MRVRVKCVFGDAVKDLGAVPCGDGLKTVKWLALVSSQRFVTDTASHGRLRQRDLFASVAPTTQILPAGVETDDELFYHPTARLIDVFKEGQEVRVKLEPKMRVGAAGQPRRSRWSTIAFCHTRPFDRSQALEDEYRDRDERLRATAESARRARAADASVSAKKMRSLIEQQLLSPEHVRIAMDNEWQLMHELGLIDKWVHTKKEQAEIYAFFERHYALFLEMFRFYCSSSSSMQNTHQMEFVEFSTFVREIELGATIDHNFLAACFQESSGAAKKQAGGGLDLLSSTTGSVEPAGFFAAMIWLAQYSKQPQKTSAFRRVYRSNGMVDLPSGFSTTEALQRLLDENIMASVRLNRGSLIGTVTRSALGSDEVLAAFHKANAHLLDVFKTYSQQQPPPPTTEGGGQSFDFHIGYMPMSEYLMLMEDSKLVGSSMRSPGKHDELTIKECRQAFSGAQMDITLSGGPNATSPNASPSLIDNDNNDAPNAAAASSSSANNASNLAASRGGGREPLRDLGASRDLKQQQAPLQEHQLLSYAEFLEAILRCALLKWDDDAHTTSEKLQMAVDSILENATSAFKMRQTVAVTHMRRGSTFRGVGGLRREPSGSSVRHLNTHDKRDRDRPNQILV